MPGPTSTASCAGAPSGAGWSSSSGWPWPMPPSCAAGWSVAPGPTTAGTAALAAAHDHLPAQPLTRVMIRPYETQGDGHGRRRMSRTRLKPERFGGVNPACRLGRVALHRWESVMSALLGHLEPAGKDGLAAWEAHGRVSSVVVGSLKPSPVRSTGVPLSGLGRFWCTISVAERAR